MLLEVLLIIKALKVETHVDMAVFCGLHGL